ncbi:MAG TPA: GTPase Era [Melioribacteraceae bacterium]|nr:GTPase Era [Melioribacteraceae bacterium]
MNTKAGYVTIIGNPNAGKSTLLNAFLGQKLSITSPKPQTTRKRILGILTEENYQVVFLDTPGILKPNYLLQDKMLEIINLSIYDADVLLYLLDLNDDAKGEKLFSTETFLKSLKLKDTKRILAINKIDLANQEIVNKVIEENKSSNLFDEIIPISATYNTNINTLKEKIIDLLPEGQKFYPDDQVSNENTRFFVSEIIREKIFLLYRDEIPYSSEVVVEEYKERENSKDYISAVILLERGTQKSIVIGKRGEAIKKLSTEARKEIEEFVGKEVFLELRVKEKSNWRKDPKALKSLGYYNHNDE